MKNGVYFIVLVFLVPKLFKIKFFHLWKLEDKILNICLQAKY